MDARQPRRFLDLGGRRPGAAIGDVVVDRVVEQHGVLRNDADGRAQARLGDVADVLPIDPHRTPVDIVEAEQQAPDRRFAGAARANDRDRLAGGDGE